MKIYGHACRFVLFVACLVPSQLWAIDYIVDVVLFEHLSSPTSTPMFEQNLYYAVMDGALTLDTPEAEEANFFTLAPTEEIQNIALQLEASSRYRFIQHFTWQQPGLAEEFSRSIQIKLGEEETLYLPKDREEGDTLVKAVNPDPYEVLDVSQNLIHQEIALESVLSTKLAGTLRISLGKYLHIDTNLVLINANSDGSARMRISRRMRSREIHYLDNPEFGLLVLITPVEEPPVLEEPIESIPETPDDSPKTSLAE